MDVFPDLSKPHKTPFVLGALGFYFPYEEGEGPGKLKKLNKSSILPCPLPYNSFIGSSWDTTHLQDRQYDIVHLADNAPLWSHQKQKRNKTVTYPVGEDGKVETWSFRNFRYLSGCTNERVEDAYSQILMGEGFWDDLSQLICQKCDVGQLDLDVKHEWENLQRPFSKRSKDFYWERKRVNDAILIALAVDYRWGFRSIDYILQDFHSSGIVLVYMGFIVNIVIDGQPDLIFEKPPVKIRKRTAPRKSLPQV